MDKYDAFSVFDHHDFFSGLSEWEDAGILAQVLAESQQEYLDNLKKMNKSRSNCGTDDDHEQPSTSR